MRSRSSRSVAAFGLLLAAACTSASPARFTSLPGELRTAPRPTSRSVITSEGIRRSGAQTAWEAIERLRPGYDFRTLGSVALLPPRGAEARADNAQVGLVVDGLRIRDLEALRAIPAEEIVAIHLLNSGEAAVLLGTGATRGAIVVQTRASLSQM
jgi:hypothetical protein